MSRIPSRSPRPSRSGSARRATPRGAATSRAPQKTSARKAAPAHSAPGRALKPRPTTPARNGAGRYATPTIPREPRPKPFATVDRRTLFKGAGAAGAIGVTASALSSLQGCSTGKEDESDAAPTVVDDAQATSVTESYTYDEEMPGLTEAGTWMLPLGTVLYPGEGTWVPAVAAGESANPVVTGAAFSVSDGTLATVVASPVTSGTNYVIYETRCSDSLYAWVELDTVSNDWALYAAPFSGGALTGSVSTLATGNANEWDIPMVAVSGDAVVWLGMPNASGSKSTEDSHCYLWKSGQSKATAVVTSHGRFACEPTISDGLVTLVPRVRTDEGVYYGISSYQLSDGLATRTAQLVLPQSVKPFSAVSMGGRLVFQIEANYSSGGLLGQMGTYVQTGDDSFVALAREPIAVPAGTDELFLVKTRASYIDFDIQDEKYGTLVAASRAVDYGEYPARVGTCSTFVTFATVKDSTTTYPASVQVRAYTLG